MRSSVRHSPLLLLTVLLLAVPAAAKHPTLTIETLEQQGHVPLSSGDLENLLTGRTLTVMSVVEDTVFEIVLFGDGYRFLRNPKKQPGEGIGREGIAAWEVSGERLVTRLDGSIFDVRIYKVDGQYFAAEEGESTVSWEVFTREGAPLQPFLTINALAQAGIQPLDDDALRSLVVDRRIVARNIDTGARYRLRFRSDGMREAENAKTGAVEDPLAYEIANGWVNTILDGMDYRLRIYQVGDDYLAAHSADGSTVKWRISP